METSNIALPTESSSAATDELVIMTPKAIEAVKHALKEEGLDDHGLRIAVQGGGCSGLQYTLDFANEERPGDSVLEFDGLKVFVDMASSQYLMGTTVDYLSGLNGTGFKFSNPNAKRTCGCGSSFS
jgi:iron-sulfur cluster assembly protein